MPNRAPAPGVRLLSFDSHGDRKGSQTLCPPEALLRPLVIASGLLAAWQGIVWATGVPRYILPSPTAVLSAVASNTAPLSHHALVTITEIALGLVIGTALGVVTALGMSMSRLVEGWLKPVLVASQAIPVFALAPILVLWLGYGMASKVAMAGLIIFFPVASGFFDGLRRTEPEWLDLVRTMGASRSDVLWKIRVPAALPSLASGLRMAVAVAPIGAVVGEWVGSSAGLGYLMLHANARLQTDLMFAALLILAVLAVGLFAAVDAGLRRLVPWAADAHPLS